VQQPCVPLQSKTPVDPLPLTVGDPQAIRCLPNRKPPLLDPFQENLPVPLRSAHQQVSSHCPLRVEIAKGDCKGTLLTSYEGDIIKESRQCAIIELTEAVEIPYSAKFDRILMRKEIRFDDVREPVGKVPGRP
jgi:hypothetical protein